MCSSDLTKGLGIITQPFVEERLIDVENGIPIVQKILIEPQSSGHAKETLITGQEFQELIVPELKAETTESLIVESGRRTRAGETELEKGLGSITRQRDIALQKTQTGRGTFGTSVLQFGLGAGASVLGTAQFTKGLIISQIGRAHV